MIIYKITNLINGKYYVGKDSHNNPDYMGSGKLLHQAIKKYGKLAFKKEILETCSTDNIDIREKYWIEILQARDRKIGYNIAEGGTGGDTISTHPRNAEIRKNQSLALTGKESQRTNTRPLPQEVKDQISKKLSGNGNPMFGKKHSANTKEKIRQAQLQRDPSTRVMSDATKQKIATANTGKQMSAGTKEKISRANAGSKNGFYHKTHSAENIEKFREIGRRPKSDATKEKLKKAVTGKYNGSQNKPFVANGIEHSSIGVCHKLTQEPRHIIRKKIANGEYQYITKTVL